MTYPKAPDEWFNNKITEGGGIFDRPSYELMMKAVSNFDTALDIGAHVGSWSIPMATKFKKVMVFEPNWTNYKFLIRNTAGIENIFSYNHAIGACEGWVGLKSGSENSGQAHVVDSKEALSQPIRIITIDSLELKSVGLIKIDVEGFELNVLKGAVATIERCSPAILVELNGLGKRYGIHDVQVKQFIEDLGYKFYGRENKDYVYVRK